MQKTVVVTGAGSGIGRAIAVKLATKGWTVVSADIDESAAIETTSQLVTDSAQKHEASPLDVTEPAQVEALADDVYSRLGLHAWVSNAGISYMAPFLEMPVSRVEQTLDVNLKGVYFCGQSAARSMRKNSAGGVIINTASMAAKQGNVPYLTDYVASKFGVLGLTQAMANELAEHKIRVNCVCPGFVATPMQSRELEWEGKLRDLTPEEVRSSMVESTPLGRLEQPEDIANAVAFLISDEASFITGEALSINGGAYMD